MENRIKDFLKLNNIIIDKKIIVAVSGGVDSICLIHILKNLGYDLVLAHVNHNFREESKIEEKEMEKLAKSLNIPFELLDYHYDGISNEHADGHEKRYLFFRSLCNKYNTNLIATAHHLDDQAETIIMKILEGSNLYGYGGISIVNDDGLFKIIRPLLCVSKEELYNYAKTNNLKYFEDYTNDLNIYERNRIRHNVIPLLKNETNDFYKKIYEYSNILKESFDFIRNISKEYLLKNENKINIKEFNELNIAVKKDIISLLLENNNIRKNYDLINQIVIFLTSDNGNKEIKLENNNLLIRSYNYAYIKKIDTNIIEDVLLDLNDIKIFNNKYKFYFEKTPVNNAKYIKLCYNKLKLPLKIRIKKDGDFINTLIGSKKISRLFIDLKLDKEKRQNTPIILDSDNNVLWVYDYIKSKEVFEHKNNFDICLICEEIK